MSQYMLIAIFVLTIALGGAGWLLKQSYAENGGLKTALTQQKHVYESALQEQKESIERLEVARAQDQASVLEMGKKVSAIEAARQRVSNEYSKWRTTLAKRTLAKPEVTRRAARAAISSRMRRLCGLTGGTEKDCSS